jgi:hypothetical protein
MYESAPETNGMVVTRTKLRDLKRDYFLARSGGGGELLMEPFCWCGSALEQDYFCTECDHKCRVTLIACADPRALSIAQALVRTNADFHNCEAATLGA